MTPTDVLLEVLALLERLEIPYLIGGSYASGIHGIPRFTNDADLVVMLSRSQAKPLVEALGAAYYADSHMIEDALERSMSFNIVHMATQFKVDFFPAGADPFRRSELARRVPRVLADRRVFVASVEDIVLAKLQWYRDGGEVSDRQWRDILGMLELRRTELDPEYLQRWAGELGVTDLLQRAQNQAMQPKC